MEGKGNKTSKKVLERCVSKERNHLPNFSERIRVYRVLMITLPLGRIFNSGELDRKERVDTKEGKESEKTAKERRSLLRSRNRDYRPLKRTKGRESRNFSERETSRRLGGEKKNQKKRDRKRGGSRI